jgi:hypothetical protein
MRRAEQRHQLHDLRVGLEGCVAQVGEWHPVYLGDAFVELGHEFGATVDVHAVPMRGLEAPLLAAVEDVVGAAQQLAHAVLGDAAFLGDLAPSALCRMLALLELAFGQVPLAVAHDHEQLVVRVYDEAARRLDGLEALDILGFKGAHLGLGVKQQDEMGPTQGDARVLVDAQERFALEAGAIGVEDLVLKKEVAGEQLLLDLLQRLHLKAEMRVLMPQFKGDGEVVSEYFHRLQPQRWKLRPQKSQSNC